MQRIASPDSEVAVFRFDRGRFWRVVGCGLLGFGVLALIGGVSPPPPAAPTEVSAPHAAGLEAPPAPHEALPAAIAILGLAGWALWRRTLRVDRREGILALRRGVGPFGWTTRRPVAAVTTIAVRRFARSDQGGATPSPTARWLRHEVQAQGSAGTWIVATYWVERTFDDSEPRRFATELAAFLRCPAPLD